MIRTLILSLLLIMTLPLAAQEETLPNPAQEELAREIMKGIRCLVCQNQSVDDSDADLARDMRRIIRERVAAGDDAGQVEAFLVARYGEWVLLKPPFRMHTALLWLAPLLFMAIGGMAIFLLIRRRATDGSAEPKPLSKEEERRLKALLHDKEPEA